MARKPVMPQRQADERRASGTVCKRQGAAQTDQRDGQYPNPIVQHLQEGMRGYEQMRGERHDFGARVLSDAPRQVVVAGQRRRSSTSRHHSANSNSGRHARQRWKAGRHCARLRRNSRSNSQNAINGCT